jgi:hypothetical protein
VVAEKPERILERIAARTQSVDDSLEVSRPVAAAAPFRYTDTQPGSAGPASMRRRAITTSFSSARWKEARMGIPIERLTAARATLVRIIKSRDDGARYIPLVLRLEREIEAMQTQTDHYQRSLPKRPDASADRGRIAISLPNEAAPGYAPGAVVDVTASGR